MSQQHSTSEIEMIAQRVVDRQARICVEKRGRQADRITNLGETIAEVKSGLAELKSTVDEDVETSRDETTRILLALEKNNTRWTFFRALSAVVSALGAIAGISGLIVSMLNNP